MRIVILDPVGEVELGSKEREIRPESLNGKVIGILDDGLGGTAHDTLNAIEQLAKVKFQDVQTLYWKKPYLSQPSPLTLIDEIAQSVDVAVVGVAG
ncbi:hypothetical protein ACFLWX_04195 [Chloroflexota bacterium]